MDLGEETEKGLMAVWFEHVDGQLDIVGDNDLGLVDKNNKVEDVDDGEYKSCIKKKSKFDNIVHCRYNYTMLWKRCSHARLWCDETIMVSIILITIG